MGGYGFARAGWAVKPNRDDTPLAIHLTVSWRLRSHWVTAKTPEERISATARRVVRKRQNAYPTEPNLLARSIGAELAKFVIGKPEEPKMQRIMGGRRCSRFRLSGPLRIVNEDAAEIARNVDTQSSQDQERGWQMGLWRLGLEASWPNGIFAQ
jgi:hypothetical protein